MTLNTSRTIASNVKIQYLHIIFCRKALMAHLNRVILGLGMYFTPVKLLSKKKHMVRHRMRNPPKLKYGFHGVNKINKIVETESN